MARSFLLTTVWPIVPCGQIGQGHNDCMDLIRPLYVQVPQQVRIDPVRRMFFAGVEFAIQRLDTHTTHQRAHMTTADLDASKVQSVS